MGKVNAIRRMRGLPPFAALLLLVGLAACAPPAPPFPELPRLGVSTQVTTKNMCSLGVSPQIAIRNAPAATDRYTVRMTNMDVLFGDPWQTTAAAQPGGFAEGALPDFPAPCVGELSINSQRYYFSYRFEVLAIDAQGRPLAYGQTTVPVYGIDRALAIERAAAEGRTPSFPADRGMIPLGRSTAVPLDPMLAPTFRDDLYRR